MELLNLILSCQDQRDPIRAKRTRRNKRKIKTVGVIVDSIPNVPITDELNLVEDEVPDSDNDTSIDSDLYTSSEGDNSSEEDDIETNMRCMFALTDSGLDKDDIKFNPKGKE